MPSIRRASPNSLVLLLIAGTFVFPFIGGSVTAYALIVLGLLLIGWDSSRSPQVKVDLGAWMFLTSWALIAIAFAASNLPGRTDFLFAANFAMFALFPLLSNALQRFGAPGNARKVGIFSLIGSLVAAGISAIQVHVFHVARAHGYGALLIPSATVALFLGFFSLLGLFGSPSRWRYAFLLGPLAGVATVLLASTRGPLLAVPLLIVVAIALLPIRRHILLGAIVAVLVAMTAVAVVRPSAFGRVAALPAILTELVLGEGVARETDDSANVRYRILQGSIAAFRDSPWVGYGWYMKVPAVEHHISESVRFGDPLRAHLHSDILDFGVSAGVVGLLAYLLALLAPVVGAARSPRDGQYKARLFAALILSVGYACSGAVNMLFGFEFTTTLYVCFAAIFIGYCRDPMTAIGQPAAPPST